MRCLCLCNDLHLRQDMDGNAQLKHLHLSGLHDRLTVERHAWHVAQG